MLQTVSQKSSGARFVSGHGLKPCRNSVPQNWALAPEGVHFGAQGLKPAGPHNAALGTTQSRALIRPETICEMASSLSLNLYSGNRMLETASTDVCYRASTRRIVSSTTSPTDRQRLRAQLVQRVLDAVVIDIVVAVIQVDDVHRGHANLQEREMVIVDALRRIRRSVTGSQDWWLPDKPSRSARESSWFPSGCRGRRRRSCPPG